MGPWHRACGAQWRGGPALPAMWSVVCCSVTAVGEGVGGKVCTVFWSNLIGRHRSVNFLVSQMVFFEGKRKFYFTGWVYHKKRRSEHFGPYSGSRHEL